MSYKKRRPSKREMLAAMPKDDLAWCDKKQAWLPKGEECEYEPENDSCRNCQTEDRDVVRCG